MSQHTITAYKQLSFSTCTVSNVQVQTRFNSFDEKALKKKLKFANSIISLNTAKFRTKISWLIVRCEFFLRPKTKDVFSLIESPLPKKL